MDIRDICNEELIVLNLEAESKVDAITKMANIIGSDRVNSHEELVKSVLKREEELTTGFGNGLAIPHGKCDAVTKASLVIATFTKPIEWESLDGNPVDIAFMIAVPGKDSSTLHLKILTKIASKLGSSKEAAKIKTLKSKEDILNFLG